VCVVCVYVCVVCVCVGVCVCVWCVCVCVTSAAFEGTNFRETWYEIFTTESTPTYSFLF